MAKKKPKAEPELHDELKVRLNLNVAMISVIGSEGFRVSVSLPRDKPPVPWEHAIKYLEAIVTDIRESARLHAEAVAAKANAGGAK